MAELRYTIRVRPEPQYPSEAAVMECVAEIDRLRARLEIIESDPTCAGRIAVMQYAGHL